MGAPKGNNFNPNGRPKIELTEKEWGTFEELCKIQCTQYEIASSLHMHRETLATKVQERYGEDFSTTYKRFSEDGKASLRRAQFKMAQKNPGMAIFLGKQWLGQTDAPAQELATETLIQKFDDIMTQVREAQINSSTSCMSNNSET